jgi:hypothetical protein
MMITTEPLTTLGLIPAVDGKRFGQFTLGYDRATSIRQEFVELANLAAAVCGVPRDEVTIAHLRDATQTLQALLVQAQQAGYDPALAIPDLLTTLLSRSPRSSA